jgi:hypothetical protein
MGYRSDLLFAFYPVKPGDASVVSWVEQHWPKDWCEVEDTDGMVLVRYSDVKWYADYQFVQAAIVATVAFDVAFSTDEEGATAHWEMIRIGEEDEDVERDGSGRHDYRMSLRREIVVN